VEWIGKIPAHWRIIRIKHVCSVVGRIGFRGYETADQVNEGEGALTLGATQINGEGCIDLTTPVFISWDKYYESPEIIVDLGDILIVQNVVRLTERLDS
jgi:type I restriction enzyme S subunit